MDGKYEQTQAQRNFNPTSNIHTQSDIEFTRERKHITEIKVRNEIHLLNKPK